MSDVARNFNHAFDRGYREFKAGCQTWQNPYQARYARNAWRAGWDKASGDATARPQHAIDTTMSKINRLVESKDPSGGTFAVPPLGRFHQ